MKKVIILLILLGAFTASAAKVGGVKPVHPVNPAPAVHPSGHPKTPPKKPPAAHARPHHPNIVKVLPDIVVEKIWLDTRNVIHFTLKNRGKGALSKAAHTRGSVRVSFGNASKTFDFKTLDPTHVLAKPGGAISFNTNLPLAQANSVGVKIFFTGRVSEVNGRNNILSLKLKPKLSPKTVQVKPKKPLLNLSQRFSIERVFLKNGVIHVTLRDKEKNTKLRDLGKTRLLISYGGKSKILNFKQLRQKGHITARGKEFIINTGIPVKTGTNLTIKLGKIGNQKTKFVHLEPKHSFARPGSGANEPRDFNFKNQKSKMSNAAMTSNQNGGIKALTPDLIISSVTSSYRRSEFVLECEIKNINWKKSKISLGKNKGLLCLYLHAPEHYDSNRLEFLTDAQVNTLNIFGSVVMKIDWPYSGETYLKIDAWEKVSESDETNNEYTYTCNYCLPNFRIFNIHYNPEGESLVLEFVNDSNCDYDCSDGLLISYVLCSNMFHGPGPLHKYWTKGIFKAGEIHTVIIGRFKWPKNEGRIQCAALIDVDDKIKETNESDNTFSQWISDESNGWLRLFPSKLQISGGGGTYPFSKNALFQLYPRHVNTIKYLGSGDEIKLRIKFRLLNCLRNGDVEGNLYLKINDKTNNGAPGSHTFYVPISLKAGESKWFEKEISIYSNSYTKEVTLINPLGWGTELFQLFHGYILCSEELINWATNFPSLYVKAFKIETEYPARYKKVKLLCKVCNRHNHIGVGKHMPWNLTMKIYEPFEPSMPIHSKTWTIIGKPGENSCTQKRFEFIPEEWGKYKFECVISSEYPIIDNIPYNKQKTIVFKQKIYKN